MLAKSTSTFQIRPVSQVGEIAPRLGSCSPCLLQLKALSPREVPSLTGNFNLDVFGRHLGTSENMCHLDELTPKAPDVLECLSQ